MLNCQVLTEKLLKIKQNIWQNRYKNYFENYGTENYLVLQPIRRYFKVIPYTENISEWKSKTLSDEGIKPATSDNSLSLLIDYLGNKIRLKFNGSCLKQTKMTYTYRKTLNIYLAYDRGASSSFNDDPTIKNSLFGAVKLTKNANVDKYWYSGYGIGFDRKGGLSFPGIGFGQNVIISGLDMTSSVHVDNKGKDILILGKCLTQGLGEHSLTAKKCLRLILP